MVGSALEGGGVASIHHSTPCGHPYLHTPLTRIDPRIGIGKIIEHIALEHHQSFMGFMHIIYRLFSEEVGYSVASDITL